MASEELPLSYSRVHITSVFLMALEKHMISWFSCAFITYSFSILTSLSLIISFLYYLPGQYWPSHFVKGVCMLSHFSPDCDPMNSILWAPLSKGFCRQKYWSELPCPPWVRDWTCYFCIQADSLPLSHQGSPFCCELAIIFHRPLKATSAVVSFESTSKAMHSCLSSYIWFALSKTLKIQSKGSSLYCYQNMSAWFCSLLSVEFCFSFTRPNTLLAKLCWSLSLVIGLAARKGDVATPGEWGERLLPCKREASISSSPPVEY